MLKKTERLIQQYGWASSICIVAFFFLIFNLLATPLINSGDDTFLLYTLSGGYGEAPTNLLHYNHIWHPWLGGMVKWLFVTFPGVNWYTITLLLFHTAGCSFLLFVLLKRINCWLAILLFLVLFVFTETRQLLSLTFTGAAFVAGAGAMCLAIHQFQQRRFISANTIFALLLLVLSGMLRLQIAWLVILLFASIGATLLHWSKLLRLGAAMVMVVALLWGLNKIQVQYYSNHIPGWKQQEQFRQSLFYSYNRQLVATIPQGTFSDSAEQQLFFTGFLYDSVKFNTERIATISKKITRNRSLANREDRAGLYWFFIELRVYILLFATALVLLLLYRKFLPIRNWLLSFFVFIAIHSYLFTVLKITMPIHLGLLLFLWMALVMQLKKEDNLLANRKIVIPAATVLLLFFGWMGLRVVKENRANKMRYQKFLCATKELSQNSGKLFVATDDAFPLNYFYIWNLPTKYPAANLLYKDRLITFTYFKTLKRFGITNLEEALISNKNVFLLGNSLPALENRKYPAVLSAPFKQYQCLEVRQLNKP